MQGIQVSPIAVKEGMKVATKWNGQTLEITKTKEVKRAEFCPGKPECWHIDGECYDTRFSTVVVPQG